MWYHSTRNSVPMVDSAQAVLQGLAPDGGLYVMTKMPAFDVEACLKKDMLGQMEQILAAFLPDVGEMAPLVQAAYADKFDTDEITPTCQVGDMTVLELFHGPTQAFKDVALSMLPYLMTAAKTKEKQTEDILILTATSGDTGKAALCGFQDVPGMKICVFYPEGGVSPIQRAQMVTQEGKNVKVCGVEGNFDDAQSGVKEIFSRYRDDAFRKKRGMGLSSANSINIGRLVPQIAYYFKAYSDLLQRGKIVMGQEVNFTVPTGNFGDILAGYLAKKMELPVGKLICASNENCVLTDFLQTGVYDKRREFHKTISPSMDILVSSNLERLLYFATDGDCMQVREWMESLQKNGIYTVSQEIMTRIQEDFDCGCCSETEIKETIGSVFQTYGYTMDTHTAVAWKVAEEYRKRTEDNRPMVVLSTASPFKFPEAVLSALGVEPQGDAFQQMRLLSEKTGLPVPRPLAELEGKLCRHGDCVRKEEMEQFVLQIFSE